jgi:hypothetical protein
MAEMKWGMVFLNDGQIQHVEWCDTPEEATAWAIAEVGITCCFGVSEHLDDEDWLDEHNIAIHEEDRQGVWSIMWSDGGTLEWQLIQGPTE